MPTGLRRMSKHHGAGNDFLVALDDDDSWRPSEAEVRALCHRRLGVGADGLIRVTRSSGPVLSMDLRNADGSVAEMSGNGIRCLVQAAVEAGWVDPGSVEVDTLAGRRQVHYTAGSTPAQGRATVAMGVPRLLGGLSDEQLSLVASLGARLLHGAAVDMGNPHLVLLIDAPAGDDDVLGLGPALSTSVAGGANVELVWPGPGDGELSLRVWERGVGETLACGTGTCAVAAAARSWNVTGAAVTVHNPGGALQVELNDQGAVLGGPTVRVAVVDVDPVALAAAAGEVAATR